jgi:curved DNA-binding protein CbpA
MEDYYTILNLNENCTKQEIKKNYHKLSKKYHPDKNANCDDKMFIKINEAYNVLYDDESRKKYNVRKYFNKIDFTDDDYRILEKYYYQIIESNEFKLLKLMYKSIPENVKIALWKRFKKMTSREIVKAQKCIDITELKENIVINLIIKKEDYENKVLKIIHIITNGGIYYLYLREDFPNLNIKNNNYILYIHFYVANSI